MEGQKEMFPRKMVSSGSGRRRDVVRRKIIGCPQAPEAGSCPSCVLTSRSRPLPAPPSRASAPSHAHQVSASRLSALGTRYPR